MGLTTESGTLALFLKQTKARRCDCMPRLRRRDGKLLYAVEDMETLVLRASAVQLFASSDDRLKSKQTPTPRIPEFVDVFSIQADLERKPRHQTTLTNTDHNGDRY